MFLVDIKLTIPGSERTLKTVFNVDDIETTMVSLTMGDNTNTTHVTTTSDHADISNIEFHKVRDLVLLDVEADGVIGADRGVGVPNGATIVSDDVGNATVTNSEASDF